MVIANTTLSLPITWFTTLPTSPAAFIQIIPANPTRQALVFVNSSLTTIAISPINGFVGTLGVYPTAQGAITPAINGAGITMQPADKFIIDNIPCTCAWVGISGGAGGNITILEHT